MDVVSARAGVVPEQLFVLNDLLCIDQWFLEIQAGFAVHLQFGKRVLRRFSGMAPSLN